METLSKIVRTFNSTREIYEWMEDPANMEELKKEYPPANFHADLDLTDLVIRVMEKNKVF